MADQIFELVVPAKVYIKVMASSAEEAKAKWLAAHAELKELQDRLDEAVDELGEYTFWNAQGEADTIDAILIFEDTDAQSAYDLNQTVSS